MEANDHLNLHGTATVESASATNKSRKAEETGRRDQPVSEMVRGGMIETELHQAVEMERQFGKLDIRAEKTKDKKDALAKSIYDALREIQNDCWSFNSEFEKDNISRNLQETLDLLKKGVEDNEATSRLRKSILKYCKAAESLPDSARNAALKACIEVEQWLTEKTKYADPILSTIEIKRMTEALDVMKDASLGLEPGPKDKTLLYLQDEHRSKSIWETREAETITSRHGGRKLFKIDKLDDRVLNCLRRAGFYGAYRLGFIKLDNTLITAVAERWRVETHSFHLPVGEATITLQDMQVLTGLQADGGAITGCDLTKNECLDLCFRLLGAEPPLRNLGIPLLWLAERFRVKLLPNATTSEVECQARAVIMFMLGGYLIPTKEISCVPVFLLQLLDDLDASGKLAWGAGALAHLYRELCTATHKEIKSISGCLHVVQLWAWERFSCFRPLNIGAQLRGELDPQNDPHGRRWACQLPGYYKRYEQNLQGAINEEREKKLLRLHRRQLDSLTEEQMTWEPYSVETLKSLPAYCTEGSTVWLAKVPLVFFHTVELHLPDRVLRQFRRRQEIPENCDTSKALHDTSGQGGNVAIDWRVTHAAQIALWDDRHSKVVSSTPSSDPLKAMDPYLIWFREKTRLRIEPPDVDPLTTDADVDPPTDVRPDPSGAHHTLMAAFLEKRGMEAKLAKLASSVSEQNVKKDLIEANNQEDALARVYEIANRRAQADQTDLDWRSVRDLCKDACIGRSLSVHPSSLDGPDDAYTSAGPSAIHPAGVVLPHCPQQTGDTNGDTPGGLVDMIDPLVTPNPPTPQVIPSTPVFGAFTPAPPHSDPTGEVGMMTQSAATSSSSVASSDDVPQAKRRGKKQELSMLPPLPKRVPKPRTCGTHSKYGRCYKP